MIKATERAKVEADARKLLDVQGNYEAVTDPYTALSQIAGELLRVKTVLGERVEDLSSLKDQGTDKYATQLDVIMSAYERFLGHSAKLLTDMSRLDLDAKIAKLTAAIDAETASIVESALAGALDASSLPADERMSVLVMFGQLLRDPSGHKSQTPAIAP